jgi:hypothetical protein
MITSTTITAPLSPRCAHCHQVATLKPHRAVCVSLAR